MQRTLIIALILWLTPLACWATVIDAGEAEALYQAGDFKGARQAFAQVVADFGAASKDSDDYKSYRELAYYYDRLADCCFTQRDWPALKVYTDGLLQVLEVERNLTETQLTGALASGVAKATASYLVARADESSRLSVLAQLKRTIALALVDTQGSGPAGEGAIRQYQQMAAALVGVIGTDEGYITLNIARLEQNIEKFDTIHAELGELVDIAALWEKYALDGQPPLPAEGE